MSKSLKKTIEQAEEKEERGKRLSFIKEELISLGIVQVVRKGRPGRDHFLIDYHSLADVIGPFREDRGKELLKKASKVLKKISPSVQDSETALSTPFSGELKLREYVDSDDEAIKIVSIYLLAKKAIPETPDELKSSINRNIRYANAIKGCNVRKLVKILTLLRQYANFKWTLETASKYLDEDMTQIEKMIKHSNINIPKEGGTKMAGENIKL